MSYIVIYADCQMIVCVAKKFNGRISYLPTSDYYCWIQLWKLIFLSIKDKKFFY